MMSKTSALAFTGIVLGSFLCASAWAFPAAPADSRAASGVIPVAEGCGRGFHRGPSGECRPNEYLRHPSRRWMGQEDCLHRGFPACSGGGPN
jgi:hypothetical protein